MHPNPSSRIRIKIDGATLFEGNPGDWVDTPPDLFKDMIKPGARPEPWFKAIAMTLSDAVMLGQNVDIAVRTSTKRGNTPGWAMEVIYR